MILRKRRIIVLIAGFVLLNGLIYMSPFMIYGQVVCEKEFECNYEKDEENESDVEDNDDENKENQEYEDELLEDLYQLFDLDELFEQIAQNYDDGLSRTELEDYFSWIMTGEYDALNAHLVEYAKEELSVSLDDNNKMLLNLCLLVFVGGIYNLFATKGSDAYQSGFYVIYFAQLSLFIHSYYMMANTVMDTISTVVSCMEVLLPTLLIITASVNGITTATAMNEAMLSAIYGMEWCIQNVALPGIHLFAIISFMNPLLGKYSFKDFSSNLKKWITNGLISFVVVFVGMEGVQETVAPMADRAIFQMVKKGSSALPSGKIISLVSSAAISSAYTIRQGMGLLGMMVILAAFLSPAIKLLLCVLEFQFIGSLLKVFAEPRSVEGLEGLAKAGELLLATIIAIGVFVLLSIVLIMNIGGLNG